MLVGFCNHWWLFLSYKVFAFSIGYFSNKPSLKQSKSSCSDHLTNPYI